MFRLNCLHQEANTNIAKTYTAIQEPHNAYLLTYLLTPWCRVLLEKLTGLQLVKKFPAFHGTRRFITALTSVCQLSLSWASPIQSIYPHPTSWRSTLILSTHLRLGLPNGLIPSGFLSKTLFVPSPHPYAPHAQPIHHGDTCKIILENITWQSSVTLNDFAFSHLATVVLEDMLRRYAEFSYKNSILYCIVLYYIIIKFDCYLFSYHFVNCNI